MKKSLKIRVKCKDFKSKGFLLNKWSKRFFNLNKSQIKIKVFQKKVI